MDLRPALEAKVAFAEVAAKGPMIPTGTDSVDHLGAKPVLCYKFATYREFGVRIGLQ